MAKTFYIASSYERIADVRLLAADLERCGMHNAFAWWDHVEHRCTATGCGIAGRRDLALKEIWAVRSCNLFVGVARLGKGSHVELGAALLASLETTKRIMLVGVDRADLVFYDAEGIEYVPELAMVPLLVGLAKEPS